MKKYQFKAIAVLLLIGLAGSGCQLWGAPEADDTIEFLKSDIPRSDADSVSLEDIRTAADNINSFAVSLYNQVSSTEGNLLFSPYSIHIAMAMTYAGARTRTEQEMEETLLFTLGQEGTHRSLNALDLRLVSAEDTKSSVKAEEDSDGAFLFRTANSIWGQSGISFSPLFLDTIAGNYGAGLRLLDFASKPDASRLVINDWVEEQTEDKIQDLLPPMSITSETRMVLTNAVYFKAAWGNQFEESSTAEKPFHLLDGSEIPVPMMNQEEPLGYAKEGDWTAVELPYDGYLFSMVIIVPDNFESFEQTMTIEKIQSITDSLSYTTVNLSLPKFSFTRELGLKDILADMGMPTAFSDSADFSGMSVEADLTISDVLHKAFIDVNEEGTEAAAATAVVMTLTSFPTDMVYVNVNRPFIFLIRDVDTGTMLFLGRVVNPVDEE